jgi:hypothetical protein
MRSGAVIGFPPSARGAATAPVTDTDIMSSSRLYEHPAHHMVRLPSWFAITGATGLGCGVLFFSQAGFKLLLWRRVLRVDK